MKISQLINMLENVKARRGDVEVFYVPDQVDADYDFIMGAVRGYTYDVNNKQSLRL